MFIDKKIFDEQNCYSLGNGMGRIQLKKDKGVPKRLYRIAKKMDKSDYNVTGFSIDFTENKAYVNYLSESELVQLCECDNICEVIEFYRTHASEEDIKITFETEQ